MTGIEGKKGRELLAAIINELSNIDPRIVPFDSDEIQSLEYGVLQAVRDVFGSGSPEYAEFEEFKISAGPMSRGDSRTEKQQKYEMGIPKAVIRLEDLLELMGPPEGPGRAAREPVSPDPRKMQSPGKASATKPAPARPAAKAAPKPPPKTAPAPPAPPSPPKPEEKPRVAAKEAPAQPGSILLLREGGDQISKALAALLEKIGIRLALLEDDSASQMESVAALKNVAFAILCLSSGPRGGLSGLSSVIGKSPQTRHESIFKLGLLVGRLGPGKVLILHSGDHPQDVPEELFGVRYLPYREEGGWQIGLLKLLKASGFHVDANLLFD